MPILYNLILIVMSAALFSYFLYNIVISELISKRSQASKFEKIIDVSNQYHRHVKESDKHAA
ncbi:hypothetical protein [Brochothrix campestris]|uniref:Uncharacterized protein n=1 Tax=Brochothrix campestris FSL F6-1037 TaxID=1265861 RepID=W7CEC5_9LIST|nr:hypothetical protein [Brochothrix campestris]EUJ34161.1 hypothetical protein BCAMP_12678 [Brochothrix campestris FSL F6-1037]